MHLGKSNECIDFCLLGLTSTAVEIQMPIVRLLCNTCVENGSEMELLPREFALHAANLRDSNKFQIQSSTC